MKHLGNIAAIAVGGVLAKIIFDSVLYKMITPDTAIFYAFGSTVLFVVCAILFKKFRII